MIRKLAIGCKGPDVLEVQKALNNRMNAGLNPDSNFGSNTQNAVIAFQKRYKLNPDGEVGSQTRSVLFPLAGVTMHIVGAYARADIPITARAGAGRRTGGFAGASMPPLSMLRGPLLASGGSSLAVGDTPRTDPLPPPIPDVLKNLPIPKDPSSGPLDDFQVPGGGLLPIPPLLTAPLLNIPGMRVISQQLQPGFSVSTAPLFTNNSGSANPSGGFILAFQSVMTRNKDQPGRLEIAEGFQLGMPLFAQTPDGTNWTMQWFAQATWADPFWATGRFHFVQPFAQVGSQIDLKQGGVTLGAGLFPVNINVDLVPDRLAIFGQAGAVLSWNPASKTLEIPVQAAIGVNITFGAF
jgi:hypothetical protein